MTDKQTEACGRCSMSTVVDTVSDEEATERDPFAEDRIEVEETEMRRVSPEVWMSRLTTRLNDIARRLTYGR